MTSWTRTILVAAAMAATCVSPGGAAERRRVCLSEVETRAAVEDRKMIPAVRAVATALGSDAGESVGIRLCHDDAAMVYDVVVLRRDGRLVHVLVDAGTGTLVPPRSR